MLALAALASSPKKPVVIVIYKNRDLLKKDKEAGADNRQRHIRRRWGQSLPSCQSLPATMSDAGKIIW